MNPSPHTKRKVISQAAAVGIAAAFAMAAHAAPTLPPPPPTPPQYTIVGLGNLGTDSSGNGYSLATTLNNSGQVIGFSGITDSNHQFIGSTGYFYSNGFLGTVDTSSLFHGASSGTLTTQLKALNNKGQIAGIGTRFTNNFQTAQNKFFVETNGVFETGEFLPKGATHPFDVFPLAMNEQGQVIGTASGKIGSSTSFIGAPFLYDHGAFTDLSSLGSLDAAGHSIQILNVSSLNNSGTVAAQAYVTDANQISLGTSIAIFANGKFTRLDTGNAFGTNVQGLGTSWVNLSPDTQHHNRPLNDSGQIAASADVYDVNHQFIGQAAFLATDGTFLNLGNFGSGGPTHPGDSRAYFLNDRGQVVGNSSIFDSQGHLIGSGTFLFSNGALINISNLGNLQNAGTLVSGIFANAPIAINSHGEVLGATYKSTNVQHPEQQQISSSFLYENGTVTDPTKSLDNSAGWSNIYLQDLNDFGEITGTGMHNGNQEAFLIKPIAWRSVATAVGPDNKARMLWQKPDGTVALWSVNSDGTFGYKFFGPYPEWRATGLAVGPDNHSHILWNNRNGQVSVWDVDPNGAFTYHLYGPYDLTTATGIAVGPDNKVRLLWSKTDGTQFVWSIDSAGAFTHHSYGPYPGWTADAIAVGPDNSVHLVWNNVEGRIALWTIDAAGTPSYHLYGPYAGWQGYASSLAVGANGIVHVLWNNIDGRVQVWNVNRMGSTSIGTFSHGPGWFGTALAEGPDGSARVLWDHPSDHQASLWQIAPNNAVTQNAYGPY